MKKAIPVVVILAIVGGLVWWFGVRDRGSAAPPVATGSSAGSAGRSTTTTTPRVDPKTLAKASVAGTITDETKAPIAGARVCASGTSRDANPEDLAEPACVTTDAKGAYAIAALIPATYTITASAKPYRPGVVFVDEDREDAKVKLAAGEARTGLDIALRSGGVEITGVVIDATGGPIAGARVRAGSGWRSGGGAALALTDDAGAFSLWVAPGSASISAEADGYGRGFDWGRAPGKFEIILTPESVLAGIVIDAATSEPVAGAQVTVAASEWGWEAGPGARTDEKGAFRVAKLSPGRHTVVARTANGYGRSDGTVLVGLAQAVDGVVVKLHPAHRITGKVTIAGTDKACPDADVQLNEKGNERQWLETHVEDDGTIVAEGVLPGTYTVDPYCQGYARKPPYEAIVVADKDVTDLVWNVQPGGTITGKVTLAGQVIEGADVWARTIGGPPRARGGRGGDATSREGVYELAGLPAGKYRLEVGSDKGTAPADGVEVELAEGATVTKDVELAGGGAIAGTVVDGEGQPVANIQVDARPLAGRRFRGFGGMGEHKTDEAGNFQLDNLAPGDYRVTARKSWSDALKKPGTTDDDTQGERTTVVVAGVARVRLVVESPTGTIAGTVHDHAGKPVSDAYLSATRESDAAGAARAERAASRWSWDERPVITSVEGAFTLTKLAPGNYTVRAYRKGGGEAFAEHVAVGAKGVALKIAVTGSIAGVARRAGGGPIDLFEVTVNDPATGFSRTEKFFRTGGQFTVKDVPKGHYQVLVETKGGQKEVTLDLADGEAKTGVTVELDALLTITGKVVEHGTKQPVAGMRMGAALAMGGDSLGGFMGGEDDAPNITDEAGAFTIEDVPRGKLRITGMPKDFRDSEYGWLGVLRDTTTTTGSTLDVGEITVVKRRVKMTDPAGELGVNWKQAKPTDPPESAKLEVSFIDPKGPAAKTALAVGDVVTTIDGLDVLGGNISQAYVLMRAPPGTVLSLGLQRGTTVQVTLAAPR